MCKEQASNELMGCFGEAVRDCKDISECVRDEIGKSCVGERERIEEKTWRR